MRRTSNARLGASFEGTFKILSRSLGVAISRMPDGCRVVGKGKLIRVSTPFDWILSLDGKTALIDTKTTDGKLFPASKISEHQVRELSAHEVQGTIAGYVVEFRSIKEVIFIPASRLLRSFILRKGIEPSDPDCVILGASADFNPRLILKPRPSPDSILGAIRAQWESDP